MIDLRAKRRDRPTKEELEALQRAREERIKKSYNVPWIRLVVAAIGVLVSILTIGGGPLSLIVAILVVVVVMAGHFTSPPPPPPRV